MKFTCKDCPKRYPGCHGKCEKYQKEKADWEAIKAAARPDKEYDIYVGLKAGESKDRAAKARKDIWKFKRR